MKRQLLARITSGVYLLGLILSGFLLSVPPDNLPIYFILLGLAIVPLVVGSSRYRIFGALAVGLTILLIILELTAGLRIARAHHKIERNTKAVP
jgi:hypothetical protein